MQKQLLLGSFMLTLLLTLSLPARSQTSESPTDSPTVTQEEAAPDSEIKESPQEENTPDSANSPTSGTEVSSEEVQKFANAIKQIQTIRTDYQTKISQAIEGEGLTQERFVQIQQSKMNPEAQPTPEISSEEMNQFEKANTKVNDLSQEAKSKMQQAVQSEGLALERFNQIFDSLEQDPNLQQEVQRLLNN